MFLRLLLLYIFILSTATATCLSDLYSIHTRLDLDSFYAPPVVDQSTGDILLYDSHTSKVYKYQIGKSLEPFFIQDSNTPGFGWLENHIQITNDRIFIQYTDKNYEDKIAIFNKNGVQLNTFSDSLALPVIQNAKGYVGVVDGPYYNYIAQFDQNLNILNQSKFTSSSGISFSRKPIKYDQRSRRYFILGTSGSESYTIFDDNLNFIHQHYVQFDDLLPLKNGTFALAMSPVSFIDKNGKFIAESYQPLYDTTTSLESGYWTYGHLGIIQYSNFDLKMLRRYSLEEIGESPVAISSPIEIDKGVLFPSFFKDNYEDGSGLLLIDKMSNTCISYTSIMSIYSPVAYRDYLILISRAKLLNEQKKDELIILKKITRKNNLLVD